MRNIISFSVFENSQSLESIFEDVKAAKVFMQKKFAQKANKNFSDLTQDEIKKAVEDRSFQKILDLTRSSPGYALPFVKFHFDQGIPINISSQNPTEEIRDLKNLQKWLTQRGNLISRLPKTIDQYSSQLADPKSGQISGFEALTDAIRSLERNLSAKWLVDRLPQKQRNEFRQLPDEKQQDLYNIANILTELDYNNPEKPITKRLLSKIKAMEQDKLEDLIAYCKNYVQSYKDSDIQKKMDQISEISPDAGIIYFEYPYLVLTIRNEIAQKKLCSIANWCINRGSWSSYAGTKGLQINIFDYSLPPSDPMFLTGTTISYNGKVIASHDLNDAGLLNPNNEISAHFKSLGYPQEVVNSIVETIPEEIEIKKTLEKILPAGNLSKGDMRMREGILVSLFGIANQNLQGNIPEKSWILTVETVAKILREDGTLKPKEFVDFFKENGIFSKAGLSVFNSMLIQHTNQKDREKILQSTELIFDELETLYNLAFSKGKDMKPVLDKTKSLMKNKNEILSELRREFS